MLARMSPDEFQERYAAHQIDPGNDSWESIATICAVLCNIANGMAGDKGELVEVADFMPGAKKRQKAKSAGDFEAWARGRYS